MRQLGLVSKPGMFVLGCQDTPQQGEGRKACFPYLFILLPAILWARGAFSIPLQGSVCLQGRCIKGGPSQQPLRPTVSAFGLFGEIQGPGHIVAVSSFS